jgi:hypothetical protein
MKIDWPSSIAENDALIVRDDTPDGLRFVVYSHRAPQFRCPTYAEAEVRTLAYVEQARVHAWFMNGTGRLELIGGPRRSSPSPVGVVATNRKPSN